MSTGTDPIETDSGRPRFDQRSCCPTHPHEEHLDSCEHAVTRLEPRPSCAEAEEPPAEDLGTYRLMLEEYLEGQAWAREPQHLPIVFHLKKIGTVLDAAGPDATAAMSSSFLQAFYRLDRQRPGRTGPEPVPPGQSTIDDFMD